MQARPAGDVYSPSRSRRAWHLSQASAARRIARQARPGGAVDTPTPHPHRHHRQGRLDSMLPPHRGERQARPPPTSRAGAGRRASRASRSPGAGAASAQAALISTSACDNSAAERRRSRTGATRSPYKLVPGGDFESGAAGWTLAGGARTVAGSEPFAATGHAGASSLYLPAGASATSPFTCVNAAYPTFRFFARNDCAAVDGGGVRRLQDRARPDGQRPGRRRRRCRAAGRRR